MENNAPDILLDAVRACADRHAMPLATGVRVVVGVSGGADSVALLHALHRLGCAPIAAHLNHCARGAESDADADFVRALAAELGLPCETQVRDVPAGAKAAGVSFETHAREVRYAFFAEVAAKHNAALVATAHHADDQAETVLMRILRGTGPEGLAGIPPVRAWNGLHIIRPLLKTTRADITAWLRAQGLAWREDTSNTDPAYLRNRVRHELLPLLEAEYNPQVRNALTRLAEAQQCDNNYWEQQMDAPTTGDLPRLPRATFQEWPEALQRRVLRRMAQEKDVELTHERLLALAEFVRNAATGAYCDVGGGWQLYAGADDALLCRAAGQGEAPEPTPLQVPGETRAMGRCFVARYLDAPPPVDLKEYCTPARQLFDADALHAPLMVRSRQDGDTLAPFGLNGRKKLKDLLVDKGVPAPERAEIPLLLAGDEIIWVVGVAPAQHAAVTPQTKRLLEIGVRNETL